MNKADDLSPFLRAAEEFLRKVLGIKCQDRCQRQLLSAPTCILALRIGIIRDLA